MTPTDPRPTLLPHPLTEQLFPSPVPPGSGWPEDPASQDTPVAHDAAGVRAHRTGAIIRTPRSRCPSPAVLTVS